MPLIDSFMFTAITAAGPVKTITVGKAIPAGVLLATACVINGDTPANPNLMSLVDNSNNAGAANTHALRSPIINQATNASGYLWLSKTTRSIDVADLFSFDTTVNRTRIGAVVAWFDDATFPDTVPDGSLPVGAGSTPTWATAAQATPFVGPNGLSLAIVIGTAATPPYGFTGGYTKIGEITTTSGSGDRSIGFGYRFETTPGAKSAGGTNTNAVWAAGLTVLDYVAVPSLTGQPKVWNGSAWVNKPIKVGGVAKTMKRWNGSAWVPIR